MERGDLQSDPKSGAPWPHAPPHWLAAPGTYLVTASTRSKRHHFGSSERLEFLQDLLLQKAEEFGWALEAWAIFSNHYHFIARSPDSARSLSAFVKGIHGASSCWVNGQDKVRGRQVWMNYRDTELTFPKSYLARLNYVHQNPVRHALVRVANQYRWCSAAWFEGNASPAQVQTIYGFKTDLVNVEDDFEPIVDPGQLKLPGGESGDESH